MTYKEIVKVTFTPYEEMILRKAYDFACENLEEDMPEDLYGLLEELQDVTKKLMNIGTDN
jgi:hypothetical protein